MEELSKIIPPGHPNRPGYAFEEPVRAFIFHSTDNVEPGTDALWHARYFARAYEKGTYIDSKTSAVVSGYVEKGSKGYMKDKPDLGTGFRVASTHDIVDDKRLVTMIPGSEYCAGAGDRPQSYDNGFKGQNAIASYALNNRQNYNCHQMEMAQNKDGDWKKTVENAKQRCIEYCQVHGLLIDVYGSLNPSKVLVPPEAGYILLLRHTDVTGKPCPRPWITDPREWIEVVKECGQAVNF